jgi:hypothetical protein
MAVHLASPRGVCSNRTERACSVHFSANAGKSAPFYFTVETGLADDVVIT